MRQGNIFRNFNNCKTKKRQYEFKKKIKIMLEKTNKISVVRKFIGLGEEVQPPSYVVPQNSTNNFYQKAGLTEMKAKENSLNPTTPAANHCPHCENMAKNFLYLESLIRTNVATAHQGKSKCSVCDSSLCYLEYVNKSILEVFGNFDSIAKAAKAFRSDPTKLMRCMVKKKFTAKKPLMMENPSNASTETTKKIPPKRAVRKNTQSTSNSNVENMEVSKIESKMSKHCVPSKKKRVGKLLRHKKHFMRFMSTDTSVGLAKKPISSKRKLLVKKLKSVK